MPNKRPTASQLEVIRYFAGDVTASSRSNRSAQATYRVCRENGWIVAIDEFPFHQTTTAGQAFIDTTSSR